MSHTHQPARARWRTVAGRGAEIGVALGFAYAIAFLVYAALRSTTELLATPDVDAGWLGTAFATWIALALPAFVFAALLAPLAALLGALTAVAVYALLPTLNPEHTPPRAILIGLGVCSLIALVSVLLLEQGTGLQWTPALAEALTFWLVLPLLVYIVAGGAASWRLNGLMDHGSVTRWRDQPNPNLS